MEYRTLNQVFQRKAIYVFPGIEALDEGFFKNTAADYYINFVRPKYFIYARIKPIFYITVK